MSWLTKTQIINQSKGKEIVFWGTGEWVEKTIKVTGLNPSFIVDINPNTHGILFKGFKVFGGDVISEENKDKYFIIVTTGSYISVEKMLLDKKIEPGIGFCYSPSLKNLSVKNSLVNMNRTFVFTVPNTPSEGGGVYIYNTLEKTSKKVFSGKARAIVKTDDFYYMVDEMEGLICFDKQFNIVGKALLLENSIPHGIAYCNTTKRIFVANSGRDSISIYNESDLSHIYEFTISDKALSEREEQHHINDLWVCGDSIFVSMFSFTGNWRKNIYDGGVLEYSLANNKLVGPIISDLWMPHTIKIVENKTYIIDSMRSKLIEFPNKVLGEFQGFIRGFDYDGEFFYITQSENRYFDRLSDLSLNIQCNSGIHVFEPVSKASRFYAIDEFENIHSIIMIG